MLTQNSDCSLRCFPLGYLASWIERCHSKDETHTYKAKRKKKQVEDTQDKVLILYGVEAEEETVP